jgi:hypothetical protein
MINGKSPGSDGYTVDFYKFFWKDIGPFVFRNAAEAILISVFKRLIGRQLPIYCLSFPSFGMQVITL